MNCHCIINYYYINNKTTSLPCAQDFIFDFWLSKNTKKFTSAAEPRENFLFDD